MTSVPNRTRVLLVEDNPGDALLVTDLLEHGDGESFQVVHVSRLVDAIAKLQQIEVHVVVLDLGLPEYTGVDTVRAFQAAAGGVPIVVVTGAEDEATALACIEAGAQDYLTKRDMRAHNLRRAIGYAMTRAREAQLRELQQMLERYRALSSVNQATNVTASLVGSGAIALRTESVFRELVDDYRALFRPYLAQETSQLEVPRSSMESVVTRIGDANGGPRDLLDIHVAALDLVFALDGSPRTRALMLEARLLALEMMGLLVDYYRVGLRRYTVQGTQS